MTSAPPILELCNLACERDYRMLFTGLSAQFYAGEMVQISGPNGAGKTTLLRMLAGVNQDYQGDIRWCGAPLNKQRWEFATAMLYLGHLAGVKKSLTPHENLRWYAALQGNVAEAQLMDALAEVNLAGYEDTPCYQLSAGQVRRVALARLEFSKARLWILDEPFTSLDKTGVARLESRLASHAQAGGVVLVTSHQDISFARLRVLNLQDFAHSQPDAELVHG